MGVSGADTGRKFLCSPWNTVSGVPQALSLRTNLVHGMGQKSEREVGLTKGEFPFLSRFAAHSFKHHSSK